MVDPKFDAAAENVAEQVAESMRGLRAKLGQSDSAYVFALVVSDDFASVSKCANTVKHLAASPGRAIDKWQFAQWFATGMDLDLDVLLDSLGDPTYQRDPELAKLQPGIQAAWLHVLIDGLRRARARGDLSWDDQQVIAFCSVIDSDDAVWVERESARLLNPAELLATFEEELISVSAGYDADGSASSPVRMAFDEQRRIADPTAP